MYLMIDLRGFLHSSRGDDRQSTEHINSIALERFVIWWSSERIPKNHTMMMDSLFNMGVFEHVFQPAPFLLKHDFLNRPLDTEQTSGIFPCWFVWQLGILDAKKPPGKTTVFWWQKKNLPKNEPLGVKFQTLLENLVRSGWFKGPFWRKIILHTT